MTSACLFSKHQSYVRPKTCQLPCCFRYELFSSLEFWSSDIRQTDGRKAMHMSPPCISTGVLKNAGISIKRENMYIASGFLIWTFPVLENLVIFITCPIKIYYCYFITLITGFNIGKTVHIMAFLKIELALHALICALCDRETGVHNNNDSYHSSYTLNFFYDCQWTTF